MTNKSLSQTCLLTRNGQKPIFLITKSTGQQMRESLCSQFLLVSSSVPLLPQNCTAMLFKSCFSSKSTERHAGVCSSLVSCPHACAEHPHTSQPWIIWSLLGGRDHPHPQPMALLPLHNLPHCGCKPCSRKSVNLVFCKSLLEEMRNESAILKRMHDNTDEVQPKYLANPALFLKAESCQHLDWRKGCDSAPTLCD